MSTTKQRNSISTHKPSLQSNRSNTNRLTLLHTPVNNIRRLQNNTGTQRPIRRLMSNNTHNKRSFTHRHRTRPITLTHVRPSHITTSFQKGTNLIRHHRSLSNLHKIRSQVRRHRKHTITRPHGPHSTRRHSRRNHSRYLFLPHHTILPMFNRLLRPPLPQVTHS